MKSSLLFRSLILLIVALPGASAAPELTSQVLLRGWRYPPGSSNAGWGEWSFNGGMTTTVNEREVDPPAGSPAAQIYPGYIFKSTAFAAASYQTGPVLRSRAQMELTRSPFQPVVGGFPGGTRNQRVNSISKFGDDLTVNVPSLPPGATVRVKFFFHLSGFTSVLLPGQTGGTVAFSAPYTAALLGVALVDSNFAVASSPGPFVSQINFQNGMPQRYTLTLFASVTSNYDQALANWGGTYQYYDTQGRSDFSSTCVLTKIEVTDTSNNPIANAQVAGSDGGVWKPLPPLKILSINRIGGNIALEASGVPNAVHTVKASPDLSPDSFVELDTVTANSDGLLQYLDDDGLTQRFYRFTFP